MSVQTIAPVQKSTVVAVPASRAFEAFTQQMGSWWKPDYSIAEAPFVDVRVEPREGGRWYEVDAEGAECPWGRVMVWEPPTRVVLAWQITGTWSYDPEFETELEIRFVEEGPASTRVELEHRNLDRYGDMAVPMRQALDTEEGWAGLLDRFAASM
jgi:hypothetical protein